MDVGELVDAALVGFDRRETVTIPPLPDAGQWDVLQATRQAILTNVGQEHPAERYRTANCPIRSNSYELQGASAQHAGRYALDRSRRVDRKSVVKGTSVSVRVAHGGRRIIKKQTQTNTTRTKE